jgi:hypothetical protein
MLLLTAYWKRPFIEPFFKKKQFLPRFHALCAWIKRERLGFLKRIHQPFPSFYFYIAA